MDTVEREFIDSVCSVLGQMSCWKLTELRARSYWAQYHNSEKGRSREIGLAVTVSINIRGVTILVEFCGGPVNYYAKVPIFKLQHHSVFALEIAPDFDDEEHGEHMGKAIVLEDGFEGREWRFLMDLAGRDGPLCEIKDLSSELSSLNMGALNPVLTIWSFRIVNCKIDKQTSMFEWMMNAFFTNAQVLRLTNVSFTDWVHLEDQLIEACTSRKLRELRFRDCTNLTKIDVHFIRRLIAAFGNTRFESFQTLKVGVSIEKDELDDLYRTILTDGTDYVVMQEFRVSWFSERICVSIRNRFTEPTCFTFIFNGSSAI